MNTIESTPPCRLCALIRAAGRVLRVALLPRTFAFIAALAVLALMAPTGIPPFFPRAKPKAEAPSAPASGAVPALASGATLGSAPAPAVVSAEAPAPAKAAVPAPARAAAAAPEAGPASTAGSAAVEPPKWRFRTAKLPDLVLGQPWEPQPMLEPGATPFRMTFEHRPPELQWLSLDAEKGMLYGKPTQVGGPWSFELKVEPLGKPDQFISQSYSLKVLPAAGPGRAAVAAPKPRAAQAVTRPELPGGPFTYRIEEDHLKELAAAPKTRTALEALISEAREAQTAAAEPDERAKYATWEALARREMEAGRAGLWPKGQGAEPARLEKLLAPLKDIDYPTEDLFRNALKLALCAHYGRPLRATGTSLVGDTGVGYEAADLAACQKAMSEEGLRRVDAIVERARKGHPPERQGDFSWRATPGCGCVPPRSEDEVMGFVSYWGTTEQQQAWRAAAAAVSAPTGGEAAQVREVDFSLFSRISYFGAVLNDDGLVELPEKVGPPGRLLAAEAHRHGTQVDLVVHRSHWETFLRRDDLPRLAARAANSAIGLLDDRQPSGWQKLLLPFWPEETHAYDGITVFFDNVPTGDMAEPFLAFREAFLERLVSGMQARKRRYGLNVVVPAERMAETGPYAFEKLIDLVEKAEPVRTSKRVDANEKSLYQGKTDITVTYLVLLPEPASVHKKALRERIDRADPPKGARRVALLESLVPVLLRSPAGQPPWSRQPPKQQYEDDVAYMKWNYLGTALWELPGKADGDPERAETLRKLYRVDNRRLPALCDVVCPQRLWLRVVLQALVGVGLVAFPLWFFSCAVRGWGVRYEAFLWIGGAVTVPLALAMLECDPALHELSESNVPLMALVALLFAGGLYWSFRLRRARP